MERPYAGSLCYWNLVKSGPDLVLQHPFGSCRAVSPLALPPRSTTCHSKQPQSPKAPPMLPLKYQRQSPKAPRCCPWNISGICHALQVSRRGCPRRQHPLLRRPWSQGCPKGVGIPCWGGITRGAHGYKGALPGWDTLAEIPWLRYLGWGSLGPRPEFVQTAGQAAHSQERSMKQTGERGQWNSPERSMKCSTRLSRAKPKQELTSSWP